MRGCSVVGCVAAAIAAVAPAAAPAAVPKTGSWDSGGRSEPTVSFEVRGSAARRTVRRVSVPTRCKGDAEPSGWAWVDSVARVRSGGRFAGSGDGFVLYGRFVARDKAEVEIHTDDGTGCQGTRRYVVHHTGRRLTVREGLFRSLVAGGQAEADFLVSAFGRMVLIDLLTGSVPAICSDGSRHPLPLGSPPDLVLSAPIRPGGRFAISGVGEPTIRISGGFDHGSVGAVIELEGVLPDGMSCHAPGAVAVGAMTNPESSAGATASIFPWPPAIPLGS